MGSVIGIYNRKGGVGKTTSVINIGASLAAKGKRVLLVDGDSQINLSRFFLRDNTMYYKENGSPANDVTTLYDVLQSGISMTDAIVPLEFFYEKTKFVTKANAKQLKKEATEIGATVQKKETRNGRDVYDISLSCSFDLALGSKDMVYFSVEDQDVMRNALSEVVNEYDYILVEFPPSFNLATMAYLNACDWIAVPMKMAEDESVDGYADLVDRTAEARELGASVQILGLFYTFVHSNWKSHTELIEMSHEQDIFFKTAIREQAAPVKEAKYERRPLCMCAPDNPVALDYAALADEIVNRIGEENSNE